MGWNSYGQIDVVKRYNYYYYIDSGLALQTLLSMRRLKTINMGGRQALFLTFKIYMWRFLGFYMNI